MLFSIDTLPYKENNILLDDTIRDVALKLTKGRGGVYLYGKCMETVSAVTVWQKYNRPLTWYELTAELRNIGINRKVPEKVFEYEDLADYIPVSDWQFIALGQQIPHGVRVRPPKHSYSMAEFRDVVCTQEDEKRLYHYPKLTEVHAVTVKHLPNVYLAYSPGIIPDDGRIHNIISTWVWNIKQEIYLQPVSKQIIDLKILFSKLHATENIEGISFQHMVRCINKPLHIPSLNEGITFWLKKAGGYITFYADGSLKSVRTESSEINAIIHYVNEVLRWGSSLECNIRLIGKSIPFSPLFSDFCYPLWSSASKERTTIACKINGGVVPSVSPLWRFMISPNFQYVRCRPYANIEIDDKEIRVCNLPVECISFASLYVESWLSNDINKKDVELCITEEYHTIDKLAANEFDLFIAKFRKAGYEIGLKFKGGVLAMDKVRYGFLPCPETSPTGVSDIFLKSWVSNVNYKTTKDFLQTAAEIDRGLEPRESVYNFKGERTGVRTRNGALVNCKKEKMKQKETEELKKITEHELTFPKTPPLYATYCALVREVGFELDEHIVLTETCHKEDFPHWCDGKLLLTRNDKTMFELKLRTDMARLHRLRSYILCLQKEINGEVYGLLENEEIIVL